jgi:two-component system response regulator YesN
MNRLVRLCVVDDIRSVVDMIKLKIPWLEYGIEVVGSAMNGEEGLDVIEQNQPDIILTDIRMPKMDGLEMTRRIVELLPHSKIIILSAYTDFEYAQKAMQYGAMDYVKKPFSIDDIVKVVTKAKEAWEQENHSRSHVLELKKKMKESLPALRQEYLSLLIHHQTEEADIAQWWGFLDIPPLRSSLVVMVIQIDQFTDRYAKLAVKELELVRFSLQNIVEETIGAYTSAVVFRDAFNRYVCILNVPQNESLMTIADACCANIASYTKFTISVGLGQEVGLVKELPRSYQQALSALSYHFYTGGNGAFSYPFSDQDRPTGWIYTAECEDEFLFAFRSSNLEKTASWLSRIFDEMQDVQVLPEPSEVEHFFHGLALRMLRILLEKFPRESLVDFEAKVREARGTNRSALHEYRKWLTELCGIGCRIIDQERASESQKIIYRSVEYIKSNLHLDLTLEHCARQANLSWGYYSNLFKKVKGTTFQQFVTQAKIELAKSMLIDDIQVQEIAQQLGYEHRRYFSEVFKRQTGLTPTEFKEISIGKLPMT